MLHSVALPRQHRGEAASGTAGSLPARRRQAAFGTDESL
jgi:hypothetical protein